MYGKWQVSNLSVQFTVSEFQKIIRFFYKSKIHFRNGYCYILNQKLTDFFHTCDKFVGPDEPEFSQCLSHDDQCLKIKEVYCVPQGGHYENLQNITDVQTCQLACSFVDKCTFFSYENKTQICELFEGQDVQCDLLIGEKYPTVTDCDNNVIITSTVAPSTTTSTTTSTTEYISRVHLQLEILDATNSKPLIKAEVEVNGVEKSTNQDGLVDFGPYEMEAIFQISIKMFGYYDKFIDNLHLDTIEIVNEVAKYQIAMIRVPAQLSLQVDLDYDQSKFSQMELIVVEVNNDFNMICRSTTR